MKIGYLGPEGTFSEEAGRQYCKKLSKNAELIPFATLHDLLLAAQNNKINEAVTPIENSVEGTISIVTDMLAKEVNLTINQELVIPVYHHLIAQKGVNLKEITDVISNPPALDQCKDFLRKKLPGVKLHLSYSTAEAVKNVALNLEEEGKVFAAIGTQAAANLYGLKVVASKINLKDNQTRFVVLSKFSHKKTGDDKTSIVFSIAKDRPGGLHDVLAEFANRSINLTKIESRPSKKSLGEYYFFVDMQGHIADKLIGETLKNVKKKTAFFKNLGSYPRFKK
ncbi:MAG: prephenate dehydratase [Candidatus Saganbacteria bacterium]|uniref:Prephenate dehydratase n=1 Tax=Candidatus Saganbacteria bacterium TaxID=2575572 RepID=A0A833L3L3_UNCSA|nr:MAG: prephenate dehydratase [Candidatus Saganbacteria bacterium]